MGIRDRTRELVKAELAEAILAVFIERGYAAVTVDDAARAAGISRATFFRYFGSKEDVVVASVESAKIDYLAGINAMPAGQHSSGWGLLRAAIEPVVQAATEEPESLRARLRLIATEPALKARLRERRAANTDALTAALSKHMDDGLSARVLATAGLAAVDIAWEEWTPREDGDFRAIVNSIFERLETAGKDHRRR
ncbi:TetR family transcriptional regulator [Arthrobacter sp. NQ7]|uniref:TetR family transcriptional regulator n=1 Tax=Arthrobacter sp. NQ7 TaxID=3032303 RepID=UPI00240F9D8D|nr:TetR family transcriptional regulator [Arthrobacter sp. NQ7]MDJ0458640.1 TetR family transcriptional regulator [Arthrobacter sp. NQ7]